MDTTIIGPPSEPPAAARIADSELVLIEVGQLKTTEAVNLTFGTAEQQWGEAGSPFRRWYRDMSSRAANDSEPGRTRQIAWKTGKPFDPRYLFFRTIDTGRLLPGNGAVIRVQFYASKSFWDHWDGLGKRQWWIDRQLVCMMHELFVLRNRHDKGGADIPIIVTSWETRLVDVAVAYWTELSKGQWSDEELFQKFKECERQFCRRLRPTFRQADLLLRSLFSDPEVGFVPPFITIMPAQNCADPRSRVLYANPANLPPRSFIETFPKSCGVPACNNPECGFIDFGACRALGAGTAMVRDNGLQGRSVVCNMWGCEVQHLPGQGTVLQQCQRCKEVYYCSTVHQTIDWVQHKDVCEAGPRI